MSIKEIALFSCFWIGSFMAQSQNDYTLQGQITDEKGSPIELATVVLLSDGDGKMVQAGYTEADGSFVFAGLSANGYRLEVSFVGLAKYVSQPMAIGGANKKVQLPPIQLLPDEAQLSEVTVTTRTVSYTHLTKAVF